MYLLRFDNELGLARLTTQEHFVIGRAETCDFRLNQREISRYHCQLDRTEEGWRILDLNSANGTFVNNLAIASGGVLLKPGDLVRLNGGYTAIFSLDEEATNPGGEKAEDTLIAGSPVERRFTRIDERMEDLHRELKVFHQEMIDRTHAVACEVEGLRNVSRELEQKVQANASGDSRAIARIDQIEAKLSKLLSVGFAGAAVIFLLMSLISFFQPEDRHEIGRSFIDGLGGNAAIGQVLAAALAGGLGLALRKDDGPPTDRQSRDPSELP